MDARQIEIVKKYHVFYDKTIRYKKSCIHKVFDTYEEAREYFNSIREEINNKLKKKKFSLIKESWLDDTTHCFEYQLKRKEYVVWSSKDLYRCYVYKNNLNHEYEDNISILYCR